MSAIQNDILKGLTPGQIFGLDYLKNKIELFLVFRAPNFYFGI